MATSSNATVDNIDRFCLTCGTLLMPDFGLNNVQFKCGACNKSYNITPLQSLFFEINKSNNDVFSKYKIFIENSSHDLAGYLVDKECIECKKHDRFTKYMTRIYISDDKVPVYTCKCGYITLEDFESGDDTKKIE